ncbi:MBOAT family protein [Flavobacterium sp. ENC]|uniref:MBOAT family O-acyltransferase n=1 Tax=Flavobacterium sp. ENC TaxID=2897330 RepID=UPI001E495F1D|nr:MBOAT family O-acyltransferase [Flavobacterium sp. ENC]MCD0466203.1 MBOAT family protein [Flavobacterium sp. ENC]
MLFNTLNFALFFSLVFILYWFVFYKSLKWQNLFLLLSSLFFYSCWDLRFTFLLAFSIGLDFYTGKKIFDNINNSRLKKRWLWLSVILNLSLLGLFKYYNFFIDNFSELFSGLGLKINTWTLQIILPVGISFYTFHGLSYVIDIYKEKIKPVNSIIDYALFVSFFPLLVAGPIERAQHLLPQIQKKRSFDYNNAVCGLRQILWGLVKKVVIADNCAEYVNLIFDNPSDYSGSTLVIGAILFSFQIYGDFSGYTDIAIGTARLLGIELLQNFSYPYFSRDIAEFWRRWHISLSSWFRDYVYIPLGGSRGSKWEQVRNVFIVFMLIGFWHGANWTFIIYGFINFLYILPLLLLRQNRKNIEIVSASGFVANSKVFFDIILTFGLVTFARIFFRSNTVGDALFYISKIFSNTLFTFPEIFPKTIIAVLFLFMCIEWSGRKNYFAIEKLGLTWAKPIRIGFYYVLTILVLYYSGKDLQFIYFQF